MGINIGGIEFSNRVFLAPMSGVTDEPFRRLAHDMGAGMVVSEMVASGELVLNRPESLLRSRRSESGMPHVVQLAGREARWMAEGARMARDLGADIIDINMGCPAKKVTKGLSGSALMRDPDHALSLVKATVSAVDCPVTLKMRLGWDDDNRNAPEIARRAEAEGVAMITVHGRTRCQFYDGNADWAAIAEVKKAVNVPVVANGDIASLHDVRTALDLSGADAVMIGRAAYGRPWLPGLLARSLDAGRQLPGPPLERQKAIVTEHYREMLAHYGTEVGVRCARKHLGWYAENALQQASSTSCEEVAGLRTAMMKSAEPARAMNLIDRFYGSLTLPEAA